MSIDKKNKERCFGWGMHKTLTKIFIVLTLSFTSLNSFSQEVIWLEDFPTNGITSDAGTTAWWVDVTSCPSNDNFEVINNRFTATDTDGEGVWYSQLIDISSYSYIGINIDLIGDLWLDLGEDYIKAYYSIDGGAETLLTNGFQDGFFTNVTASAYGLSGSTVQIIIRIYSDSNNEDHYFDNVTVFEDFFEPCYAKTLSVGSSCNSSTFTNEYAYNSSNPGDPDDACIAGSNCCGAFDTWNSNSKDIWFNFIVPASGNVIIDAQDNGGLADGAMAVYSGADCNNLNFIICNDDGHATGGMPQISLEGRTPGETIWIRFWGYNTNVGSFDICVYDAPTPDNDLPCDATQLAVESSCNPVSGTNAGASDSGIDDPGCGTYNGNDVWYYFIAPASQNVTVQVSEGTLSNAEMAIYTGSCTTLSSSDESDCDASAMPLSITDNTYTEGDTVWVRVWGDDGIMGTFDICVYGSACSPISVNAGTDSDICDGDNILLGGSPTASGVTAPFSYAWTPITGLDDETIANPTATPTDTTTYTVIVTDNNGCQGSDQVTINLNPNPTPSVSGNNTVCPGATGEVYSTTNNVGSTYLWEVTNGTINGSATNASVTIDWNNNCNTTGTVKVTETISATSCATTTADFSVTIKDDTAPTWTTVAGNLDRTVECDDAAALTAAQALFPVADDNCDADVTDIVKTSGAFVAGACSQAGTYTNTWVVTDDCGNTSAVYTQTITVEDTQEPTWTTVAGNLDRTVECDDAAALTAAQALFPVADDNCDADVTDIVKTSGAFVAGACSQAGTYTNTWVVTDDCGNTSAVYTQTITVEDTQEPTWTTVAGNLDRTVECDDAAALTAAQALFPVADDNCDADVTDIVKTSGAFVAGACSQAGTYTNTWVVTDDCGNTSAVYTQTITVEDTQEPTWTTVAGNLDRTVECDDAAALTAAQALFPVADDNCDADVTDIVKTSGAFVAGACSQAGTYTNTWVVTDDCGNTSAVYTQTITVEDTQEPTWTTVAGNLDRTVECDDAAALTAAQALFPVADDNCDADVTDIVKTSGAFVAGACSQAGTYTNTWVVTDDCGNTSAVYTQTITVEDTQEPTWTTVAGNLDRTVECDDAAALTAAQALFPVADDNCDADVTDIVKTSGAFVAGACSQAGTYTNTWVVTDDCGNTSAVYTQTITVEDTQEPTWTTVAGNLDRTVECDDAAALTAAQALFPVADDNCDADVTDIVKTSGAFVAGACSQAGTYTNTWVVNDDCGNTSAVYTQTITVEDTQEPTWTTVAGNLDRTVECDDAAALTAAQALFPVADDNCDADVTDIVKTSGAFVAGACSQAGTYTNTWVVTDDCGNTSAVYTQTITVEDTQEPTWTTVAGNLDRTVECDDAAALTAAQALFPVADDNCDADVTDIVKTSGAFVAGACSQAGTYTNTWVVTDDCGNTSAVYTQTITVEDTQEPTWTTVAGNLDRTVECDDAAALTAAQALFPVADDNCDADVTDIVKTSGAFVAGACSQAGTYTNTWVVTDDCGNTSAVYTQTITVEDTQEPTWTTVAGNLDRTVECDDAAALTAAQALFPVADDNCDADVTDIVKTSGAFVAGACSQAGTYTNTWVVTDDCGNTSAVYTQTITVEDTQEPTWTTVAGNLDRTVECDDAAALTAAQALFPVADDNCDADVTDIVKTSGAFVAGACSQAGTYTNTWVVTDDCGNTSAVYTQTITVEDTQEPTWTTVAGNLDRTVECDDAAALTAAQALFPVADDNCDADVTDIVKTSGAFVAGACSQAGTYTNTWVVTDDCGNTSAVYTQTITVEDTQEPTWTTVAGNLDRTVECDDAAALTAAQALFPVADDNCDADVTDIVKTSGAFVAGACSQAGTYTNTWVVTDDCGNTSAVYTQTITVEDTQEPTWTTVAGNLDRTVECDDAAALTAAQALFPVADDNCDADVTDIVKTSGAFVAGACSQAGTYTNTWVVTDDCGNTSAVYTQTITVEDTQEPTWTTVAGNLDRTVECDDAAALTAAQALFPVADDNCDADVTDIVKTSGAFVAGACSQAGTYTNTWVVTDDCGNTSAVYTQTITVEDTQEPTWTTVAGNLDRTVECDDAAALTAAQALFPVADDNCDADVTDIVKTSGAFVAGACSQAGTYTNTWVVTDDCGNTSAVYTQTITVEDTQEPTWTTVAGNLDRTVECDDAAALTAAQALFPVADDNCDADVTDIVKTSGAFVAGACSQAGTYTNTWVVTDDCGNTSAVYTQTITVEDTQEPTWTTVAGNLDRTVECDDAAALTAAQALFPVADDNCDADVTDIVKTSGAFVAGACSQAGTYTNTWVVTDDCGNTSAVYTQTITVEDTQEPTWTTVAGNLDRTVECDDAAALTAAQALFPVADDNCDADVTDIVKTSGAFVAGACSQAGTYTNTWVVTDDCGNTSAVYTQTITVEDTQEPTWTTVAGNLDRTVECDDAAALTAAQALFPVADDNCDADVTDIVKTSGAFVAGACSQAGTYTNTWVVTDDCGNTSAVYTQTITVEDTQEPTFTAPSDITICTALNCSVDYTIGVTGDVLDETDNCSVGLDASYSDDLSNLGDCDNFGFIARTWSLTDDCGNTAEKVQYIYIEPLPKVILVPQTDTLCNNETTNISISSITEPEFPVRFKYVVEADYPDSVNVINGIQTGLLETDLITDLIQNLSSEAQRVLFIVTPYSVDGTNSERCTGINDTTIVWVEPTPVITAPADTICDLGTTDIDISSNQTPTREVYYTYSSAPDNVGAVTGNTSDAVGIPITTNIQDVLDNTTDTKQRVVYTITPHVLRSDGSIGCAATPITVDIWVEPTPVITAPADTICDLGTTDIDISSNQTPTREVYYTYSSAPDNVGAVTGNTSDAVGIPITTNIQDVLDNTTDTKQRVVYTITPHVLRSDGSIGCAATPITVDIWVEPTPVITAPADTICDLGTTDIDISSNQTPTREVYYTYSSAPDNVGAVTGNTSDAVGIPITTNIQDVLDNTTDTKQRVVYTITPHVLRSDGSIGCAATPITVDIWVEPTPVITAPADTICDLGTTDIDISSNQTPTREVYYTYSSAPDNVGAVTGNTSDAVGIPITTNIQDVLDNTTDTKQRVVYTITPHVLRSDGSIGCAATPITVDIWVEPTPVITAPADTICDLGTTDIDISSNQTPTREVYYTYSSAPDNVGAVTGNTSDAVGIPITTNIQDVLDNTTDTKQRVVYTITPHVLRSDGSIGCAATPITVDIWVEPTPVITAPADTICDLGTTDIDISSNQTPTREVYYTYSSAPDNVGAVTGNTSDAVGIPITTNIQDVLDNTTDTKQRVVYTITPHVLRSDGSIGCAATPITVDIWVEPTPVISAPADTICDLGTTDIDISSNQTPTREVYYTYSSAPDNVGAVTGNTSDAVGIPITTNIQDVLDNTTDTKQRVVYTITPHVLRSDGSIGCAATPITVDIWVEPTPVISAPADTICDLGTTDIDISSNQTPTREVYYTYSSAPDNVGAVTGNTSDAVGIPITTNIQDVLDNTTDTKQRVVYTITPHVLRSDGSIGCAATPITVDIWVEPTPVITAPADTICDLGTTDIDISSNQTPTREVYYTYSSAPDNVGAVTGNTSDAVGIPITTNIQDVLDNTTDTKQRVVYTITPHVLRSDGSIGCAATPITVDIWVEPTPVITAPADTICDLGTTDIDISSNQTPTREVYYTYSSAPDNVGAVTGNTSDAVGIPITTNIQDVLDNTTDTKQRVVYTITPHVLRSDGSIGCAATPITVDIWVEPTPVITAPADTICDLGTTDIDISSNQTPTREVYYTYSSAPDNVGAVTGNTSDAVGIPITTNIQDVLDNTTDTKQRVVYTITPHVLRSDGSIGCAATPITVDIWVEPTPVITAPADTICDLGTTDIDISSNQTPTREVYYTYSSAPDNVGAVTGNTSDAVGIPITTNIQDVLDNTTDTKQRVVYTITPHVLRSDGSIGCAATPITVDIWVEPTPVITAPADTICDLGTTDIDISSNQTPTREVYYTYSSAPDNVGAVTGNTSDAVGIPITTNIQDVLDNTTDTKQRVVYTITPHVLRSDGSIGCAATPITVDIWVEPTPVITAPADTICDLGTTDIDISSNQTPTREVYYTYSSAPDNVGAVTGNTSDAVGIPITTNIQDVLDNTTDTKQRVVYTITPHVLRSDGSIGCAATPITVDIWVEPTPVITAPADTICDLGTTDIDISSNQTPTREVYYTYSSAPDNVGAVTGNTSDAVGIPITTNIQDVLDNTTDTKQRVVYTITPHVLRSDGSIGCAATPITVDIWVEPTPVITAPADTICDLGTTNIDISSNQTPTREVYYTYSSAPDNVGAVTGNTSDAVGIPITTNIQDVLDNTTDTKQRVVYTITPHVLRSDGSIGCAATPITVDIWVEPTPVITAPADTICDLGTTDIDISSNQTPTREVYYTYSSAPDNVGAVTGNTSDAVGIPITTNIQDVLDNTTDTKQRVVYTITPHVLRSDGSIGCAATPITVDIWVEPTPVITAPADTICDLGTTDIDISSNQTPTREVYYTYSSAPDNVGAVTGNTSDAVGIPITTNIQDVLDNTTDTKQRVVYTITPHVLRSDGSIGCAATPITVDIWVEPTPVITAPADTICDLGTTDIDISSNQTPTREVYYTYSSAPDNVGAVTGNTSDAVGIPITTNIQDVLDNTTDTKQRVVYTITPHVLRSDGSIGCAATPITVDIWVEPTPVITAPADTICDLGTTNIDISSNQTPTREVYYTYSSAPDNVGAVTGNTSDAVGIPITTNIQDVLDNTTDTKQRVVYTITPHVLRSDGSIGCAATPITVDIWVEPTPVITAPADTICDLGTTDIDISSNQTPTREVYYTYSSAPDNVGAVTGNTSDAVGIPITTNIQDVLDNTTDTKQRVVYTITPHVLRSDGSIGCAATPITVDIWVEPTPVITAPADTICDLGTTDIDISSNQTPTREVYYTYSSAPDNVGAVTGNTSDAVGIPITTNIQDVLDNTTDTKQRVVYTITPHVLRSDGSIGCAATPITVDIWVEPTPVITAPADTICDLGTTDIDISSNQTPTREVYYTYSSAPDNVGAVTGNTSDAVGIPITTNIQDVLDNTTDTKQRVVYTITPHVLRSDGSIGCAATPITVDIWVEPTPVITAPADTICDLGTTDIDISSNQTPTREVYYTYSSAPDNVGAVTGNTSDAVGIPITTNIQDVLDNTTDTKQRVVYTITPHVLRSDGSIGCAATPITVDIWVEPTPVITAPADTICDLGTTDIDISSNQTPTREVYYTYSSAPDNVGAVTGNTSDAVGIPITTNIQDVLDNTTDTKQRVVYTITPHVLRSDGSIGCAATPITVDIWVNPEPLIEVAVNDTLCFEEGTTFNISTLTPSGNTTGTWVYDVVTTISDPSVSGNTDRTDETALSFTDNLVNNSNTLQWVDYEFTAKILDPRSGLAYCSDGMVDTTIRIYINPEPLIEVAVNDTLCFEEGTTFNISTLTPSANTTGTWVYDVVTTISDPSVSGNTDRTDETALSFTDNLVNNSNTLQWVDYEFTAKILDPRSGLAYCSDGTVDTTIRIYINPEPLIEVAVNDTLCFEEGTTFNISTLTPSANTTGTWVYDVVTTISDPSVSGNTDRTDETALSFTDNLVNTSNTLQWVDYEFTAKILDPRSGLAYCSNGTVDTTIRIYINPEPLIEVAVNDTLCFEEGTTFNISTLTPSANTTGTWVYDVVTTISDPSVSGNTDRTDETALSFTDNLVNNSNTLQWVDYEFTAKILDPRSGLAYCSDGMVDTTIRIYINPEPLIEVAVNDTLCFEEGTTFNISTLTPSGNTTGTWVYDVVTTISDPSVSGNTDRTDETALSFTDNLVNNSNTLQWVDYEFTAKILDPRSGLTYCSDGSVDTTIRIYINPEPLIELAVNDTLCFEEGTTFNISTLTPSANTTGTWVYDVVTTISDPSVSGNTDRTDETALSFTDNLVNNSNTLQWVDYEFTAKILDPRSGLAYCSDGMVDTTIRIYINPEPLIEVAVNDTLCFEEGTSFNISTLTPSANTTGTWVYDVVTTISDPSVSGNTDRTDETALSFTDNLVNTSNTLQWVDYEFTAKILDPRSGLAYCSDGTVDTTIRIYINPEPLIQSFANNDTLCYDEDAVFNISTITPSANTTGTWVYDVNTIVSNASVSGNTDRTDETTLTFTDNLINSSDVVQWVDYQFTAKILNPNTSLPYCTDGIIDTTIRITLNPLPRVIITVLDDSICNDTYTHITLTTPTLLTDGLVKFDYSSLADIGLTGHSTGLTDLNNNYLIEDSLHNISTAPMPTPLEVVYSVTPSAGLTGCANGPTMTETITVHPTAYTQTIADSVVCYLDTNGRATVLAENGINDFIYNWNDPSNHQTAVTDSVLSIGWYKVTVTDNQGCIKEDSILIEQPDRIIPVIDTVKNVSCFGAGDGYIVLNPLGGNSGYTYNWSNGKSTDSIYGLDGALYYATVTDWKGCAQDTVAYVEEPPQISIDVFPHHVRCYGENNGWAEVDAVGVDTYIWSTGETTAIISNLSPGPYSVTATNAEGCKSIQAVEILEPDSLVIENIIHTDISCAGDADGTFDLQIVGGNTAVDYTYNWWTPDGTGLIVDQEDQSGLSGGKYYVTVTDWRLCEANDSAYINEPPLYYANLTSSDITCNGDHDGSIDLMVNGGNTESPYTYSWTTYNGSGLIEDQEDQDGLEAGTYYVTVYDAKNCELKDTAIIVEPDLLESFLTETNSTCYGYNDGLIVLDILGGTGNYTIEWSNGATEDSIYGLGAGTYYVTVTDEHHCSIDNYVEITEPDQIQNNLISENITCYGYHNGQIKITPEGGTIPYSYLWSHSGIFADSIANNLGPGTYTISVVDNNNCIEVSEVDITEPDELSLTVTKEDITCFGMNDGYISLSMFGGTPDYTYNWSNGITDPSADMLSEGYYSINIQDIHNCLIDTNIFIEEPEKLIITPEIRRPTCPDIQDGYIELNIAGGRLPYTIYWDDGTHEDNLYDIRSGIFDVLINDSSLCEIDTSFIVRSAHDFCIDIPTAFSPNNDNINDKWVIEMDGLYPHAEIEVFDRWGKRVFYSKGYDESKYWDGTYNGKDLPMDAYYYIIYLKNGSNRISGTITIIR